MSRRLFVLTLAPLVALCAAVPARAGLLPVNVSVTPEGGNFQWTYAVVLPTDSQLRSGDYFTIYDFGGLVAGSIQAPTGWAGQRRQHRLDAGAGEPERQPRTSRT